MCKDYTELCAKDKRLVSQVLALKHELVDTKATFDVKSAKVFDLVKLHGSITKDKDKISFVAQGASKPVFDVERFAKEQPELFAKYLTVKEGAREHLVYNLH